MHTFPSCTGAVICRRVWTAVSEPRYQLSKHPPSRLIWHSCQSRHFFFLPHLSFSRPVEGSKGILKVLFWKKKVLTKFRFLPPCRRVCLQQSRDDLKTSILWSAFWMQMLNARACISCTCRRILTQDKCGCLSESMNSLLNAPSVQRNAKKCLENANFEKLVVLPSSGSACWGLDDSKIPECSKFVIVRPQNPRKAVFKFSCASQTAQRSSSGWASVPDNAGIWKKI